jgi:hypothetical protein
MNGRTAGWIPSVLIQDNDGGSDETATPAETIEMEGLVIINPNNINSTTSVADSACVAASDPTVGWI